MNDVFVEGTPWQICLDHVNNMMSYFKYHPKAKKWIFDRELKEGSSQEIAEKLKHDIPARWHSRLMAMETYFSRVSTIATVRKELFIPTTFVNNLSTDRLKALAEYIKVVTEVRSVGRELETDRVV